MNRQIRRLGIFMLVLYLAVFAKLNQVQVFESTKYETDPLNSRRAQREYDRERGKILSVDGTVLAESLPAGKEGGQFRRKRVYPQGDLFGQITGYLSFRFGTSGMERSYNDELTGQTFRQQAEGFNPFSISQYKCGHPMDCSWNKWVKSPVMHLDCRVLGAEIAFRPIEFAKKL